MTIEETPLSNVRTGPVRARDDNLTLAKVREVTGASDEVIKEAIRACRCKDGTYKVEDVVTTIIGDDTISSLANPKAQNTVPQAQDTVDAKAGSSEPATVPSTTVGQGSQTSQAKVAVSTMYSANPWKQASEADDYIDLTRDPQGILGGQITREEQDISRVLEASLAESKNSSKRKRGEIWFSDPMNPHERKRADNWPVGLRNVGNTCWFSAVIQSLFHIQKFRNIVLNYKSTTEAENEINHKLRFVLELRQLFGLMVGSNRKYVDPSMAVNILKEASSSATLDGQQDVSEFQHKLLDWLEDAFGGVADGSSTPEQSQNPVHQLFQGKYKAEGFNQGKAFSQEVTFGQYPLNVLGFRDIHESLEATTAQGEIETVSGDSSHTSGQEIWFTHLPVVLTFELSRFGFNQQLNRAEKIHQQLSFPSVIYVDRYLECNKSVTRQKREEARKLKEELAALQARLDKFMNFGSNTKRYPLPDVLQYALEFAETSPPGGRRSPSTSATSADVEMKTTPAISRDSQDVPMTSVGKLTPKSPCGPGPVFSPHAPPQPSSLPHQDSGGSDANTTATQPKFHPFSSSAPPSLSSSSEPTSPSSSSSTIPAALQQHQQPQPLSPSYSYANSPCPAPEPKRFKDSSVQVEFEAGSMPISITRNPTQPFSSTSVAASSSISSYRPHSSSTTTTTSLPSCVLSDHSKPLHSGAPMTLTPALPPHPRSCSANELTVLQGCLRRWREEVEADVRELQRNISSLESKLDGMYSDECMKKYPYHLHAVLVHEGQAVSGHYWSFIHDWSHQRHHPHSSGNSSSSRSSSVAVAAGKEEEEGRWLKFNDITVSESSLAEVQREGVGGYHNASAYCLMYIDRSRLESGQGDANSGAVVASGTLKDLPEDLQLSVEDDNQKFLQEIAKWDLEQKRKASAAAAAPSSSAAPSVQSNTTATTSSATTGSVGSPSSSSAGKSASTMTQQPGGSRPIAGRGRSLSGDQDVVMTGEQRPGEKSIIRPVHPGLADIALAHARLSLQATLTAVSGVTGVSNAGGTAANLHPRDVFKAAFDKEYSRLKGLSRVVSSRLPAEDPRLTNIVLYLLTCCADNHTVKVILMEQFALCGLLDSASVVKGVRHEAQELYRSFYATGGSEGVKLYEFWHKRYHHFRQAVFLFMEGVSLYMVNKYQAALPHFNHACLHNNEPGVTASLMHPHDGLNPAWLAYFRRLMLQYVNEQALQAFERDEDLSDALTLMTQQILPTLALVASSELQLDQELLENIRGVWCQFLEKDLSEEKVEKLQDFLSKMFEAGQSLQQPEPHKVKSSQLDSLADGYAKTMRRLQEIGEMEKLVSLTPPPQQQTKTGVH